MKQALLIGTATVFLSAGLAAQGRNFAGTWAIDAEKTSAAGGGGMRSGGAGGAVARSGGGGGAFGRSAGGGDAGAMAAAGGGRGGGRGGGGGARSAGPGGMVTSAGMTLTIDAGTFTIAQGPSTMSYRTDGSVINLDTATRKASAKAAWQGDKLVIETTTESPNGSVVTRAVWYLEGESLVRENQATLPDGQESVRKTYFKRSEQN